MANNKVQLGDGTVLVDMTDATASADKIVSGYTAYGADGSKITGTADNAFIITLAYDDHTSKWVPNKAFYEISDAYTAGKEIVVECTGSSVSVSDEYVSDYVSADGEWRGQYFGYWVRQYQGGRIVEQGYDFNSDGLLLNGTYVYDDTSSATLSSGDQLLNGVTAVANGTTYTGTIPTKTSSNLTASGATVTVPSGYYSSQVSKSVASGTEGTPTATKGTVSNHSVSVTPAVTNTAGYISGGTKTGTAVTVSASELVSGSQTITENGTVNVTNLAQVVVSVPSIVGSVYQDQDGYLVISPDGDGGSINLQSKTAVPTTSAQTVVADSGYDGLSEVTVEAIPSAYIIPSGTLSITSSGTYDVASYASANVNVSGGGGSLVDIDAVAEQTAPSGDVTFSTASYFGAYVFMLNPVITGVEAPNAGYVGYSAFTSCSSLTKIDFPSASRIGDNAFKYCYSLSEINIPNVTKIEYEAFRGCSLISVVDCPALEEIGGSTFLSCSGLRSVNIPQMKSIGNNAFGYCTSLTTISLPNVKSIGNSVFRGCTKLESAYFMVSSIPSIGTYAFQSTPLSVSTYLGYFGSIFVRQSLLASFQTATNWSAYSARMVGLTDAEIEALE